MSFRILLVVGFLLLPPPALAQPVVDQPQPHPENQPDVPALDWLDFGQALEAAEVSGRTVIVDVYAPWCPWCAKLQTEVYGKADIRTYLNEHFEKARLNIDDEENVIAFKGFELKSSELASGLGAEATPTVVFLTSTGEYITRVPGFVEADEFMHILRYISTGSFQSESFQDFLSKHP